MYVAMKIFIWLFSFAVTVYGLNNDLPFVGGEALHVMKLWSCICARNVLLGSYGALWGEKLFT